MFDVDQTVDQNTGHSFESLIYLLVLALVVQRLDSAMQGINHCPLDISTMYQPMVLRYHWMVISPMDCAINWTTGALKAPGGGGGTAICGPYRYVVFKQFTLA